MIVNFDDLVSVSDDILDVNLVTDAYETLTILTEEGEGTVQGSKKNLTKYSYWQVSVQSGEKLDIEERLFNHILSLGVVPVIPEHDINYSIRVHKMGKGGKMTWHYDGSYSIALSIYLSECSGGELEIELLGDNDYGLSKNLFVSPRKGRMVVMKCDTRHRVLRVKDGERRSIQIFITYLKKEHA